MYSIGSKPRILAYGRYCVVGTVYYGYSTERARINQESLRPTQNLCSMTQVGYAVGKTTNKSDWKLNDSSLFDSATRSTKRLHLLIDTHTTCHCLLPIDIHFTPILPSAVTFASRHHQITTSRPPPHTHTQTHRHRQYYCTSMLAIFGSWLGLHSTTTTTTSTMEQTTATSTSGALSITPRRSRTPSPNAMKRTKSSELLESSELIKFLCEADESIKVNEKPLDQCVIDRLDILQTQASVDDCDVLFDITDHLLNQNFRLKQIISQRRFGGSADQPLCALGSLVC